MLSHSLNIAVPSVMTASVIDQLVKSLIGCENSDQMIFFHAAGCCKVLPDQEAPRDHHSDRTQVRFGFMSSPGGWRIQCYLPTSPEEWIGGPWGTPAEFGERPTSSDLVSKSLRLLRAACLLYLAVGGFHSSWHLFGLSDDCEQWDRGQTAHHRDWLVFQLLWLIQYLSNFFEPVTALPVYFTSKCLIRLCFYFHIEMLHYHSPSICRSHLSF